MPYTDNFRHFRLQYGLRWNPSGQDAIQLNSSGVLTANQWNHLNFVYDGSQEKSFLYLNGQLINSADNLQTSFINRTETMKIGTGYGWGGSTNPKFNGLIDEVKIYSYARSADQVKSDYAAGSSTKGSVSFQ